MDPAVYRKIVEIIRRYSAAKTKNCLENLEREFKNYSHDTLYSIVLLEYQRRMKRNHRPNDQNSKKYYELYMEAVDRHEKNIILRLSEEFDVCPSLIAKLILQKYCKERNVNNDVQKMMRDTWLIPDAGLSIEIHMATLFDFVYGPLNTVGQSSLGEEYEIRLRQEAVQLGLAFRDEKYLKSKGFDKTPDMKLDVPIMIDGCLVYWIESKALFGDQKVHAEYVENQYSCYWNRFGPGLVIYWFGFLKGVADTSEERFIVKDHLPTNFSTFLEALPFRCPKNRDKQSCLKKTRVMFQ